MAILTFLEYTWVFLWVFIVVLILRAFRSASSHDEEFESSHDNMGVVEHEHPSTWHRCPHNIISGGHAA